jgi:hypothetical protein
MSFDLDGLSKDGLRVCAFRAFRAFRFNLLSIDPTLPILA